MSIQENLLMVKKNIPDECSLIAVSKTQPVDKIKEAYDCGQRLFGENKVQELTPKYEALPKDILWHAIGHLQTNKVKYIASFVSLIHSVDSIKLLEEINKQGLRVNRVISCLLQMHIAEEETKFGFSENDLMEILALPVWKSFANIEIKGLMGMATMTENENQIRREFSGLKCLFEKLKSRELPAQFQMEVLSMGMSGDFKIALQEGSTMVRVGSAIFGQRNAFPD